MTDLIVALSEKGVFGTSDNQSELQLTRIGICDRDNTQQFRICRKLLLTLSSALEQGRLINLFCFGFCNVNMSNHDDWTDFIQSLGIAMVKGNLHKLEHLLLANNQLGTLPCCTKFLQNIASAGQQGQLPILKDLALEGGTS